MQHTSPIVAIALAVASAVVGCSQSENPSTPSMDQPERPRSASALINHGPTLRVGWMGMDEHVGEGPGGNTAAPIYKVVQWNPHAEGLADVPGVIARADSKDIILLAYTPGPAVNFGLGTAAGYDSVKYNRQLNKLDSIPAFRNAAARGRVHCYMGDEPHLPEWDGTWTPDLFNRAAGENKKRWPSCRTYGRVSPEFLWNGWDGRPRPPGAAAQAYKYLDYAWLQYAATYRKRGENVGEAIDSQKVIAVKLNVGLALSMNMANGGYRTNLDDNVNPCWNADTSAATPNGLVIGTPPGTYNEGQKVPCSPAPPTAQNLMVNPALIRKIVDEAKTDRDIPFVLYWARPESGTASGFLDPYVSTRPDFVSAFDYGITEGAKRTMFNGYRTPKPYP